MPISAIIIPALTLARTTPSPRPMLERQLLPRAQALPVIVVAILARLALALQMVVVAHLLLLGAVEEARLGRRVGLGQVRVQALVVLV